MVALGAVALAAVLVRLVMWRLAWLECRPVTARMKRGQSSRLWLLMLVLPALGVLAVWLGDLDAARWCAALACAAPFLFASEKFWMFTTESEAP